MLTLLELWQRRNLPEEHKVQYLIKQPQTPPFFYPLAFLEQFYLALTARLHGVIPQRFL